MAPIEKKRLIVDTPATKAKGVSRATDYYWPIEEALIRATKSECDKLGAKLIILRLPKSNLVHNGHETKLLEKIGSELNIPVIETDKEFTHPDEVRPGQGHLFFSNHLAPTGHRIVADKLDDYIRSTIGMPNSVKP